MEERDWRELELRVGGVPPRVKGGSGTQTHNWAGLAALVERTMGAGPAALVRERGAAAEEARTRCTAPQCFSSGWFAELQELAAWVATGGDTASDTRAWASALASAEEGCFVARAMAEADGSFSHLLCHAAEGFFLPRSCGVSLRRPLFDETGGTPGGWLGSTDALLDELIDLAHPLGLELRPLKGAVRRGGGMDLSPASLASLQAESAELRRDAAAAGLAERVRAMWFLLYEGARASKSSGKPLCLFQRQRRSAHVDVVDARQEL